MIWGHTGSFRDHLGVIEGSFVVILGHLESIRVIQGHSVSFGVIRYLLGVMVIRGHLWSLGDHSGSFGAIWGYSGPFRTILCYLKLFRLGNSFILDKP